MAIIQQIEMENVCNTSVNKISSQFGIMIEQLFGTEMKIRMLQV